MKSTSFLSHYKMQNCIPFILFILFFVSSESLFGQSTLNKEMFLAKAEQCKPALVETIVHPKAIVEMVKDSQAFQGWAAKTVSSVDELYQASFRKINTLVLDFGDHYTGYFTFKLDLLKGTADGPLRFKFTFGEVPAEIATPFDPYTGVMTRAWLQDEIVTVMDVPATVTLDRRMAFRYLKIELLGSSPYFDFRISELEFKAVSSAAIQPEPLASTTSDMIREIDRVGQKTLKECMQTVYEDGPKRDRRLWVGDMYLESLANTYSFKNHNLTKRCLYLLGGLADENNIVLGTCFETPEPHAQAGQRLLDYSLIYNVALKEYLVATGDKQTANDLWPLAKNQLNIVDQYLDENGMIDYERAGKEWWIFIEWKDGLHKQAAIQGLMIFALKETYELADLLGKTEEVSYIPSLVKKMSKAAKKELYNKQTGLIESGPDQQISYASQIWMVLSGVLSERESQKALLQVMADKEALYPGGPYMFHYFIQALINSGLNDLARESLVDYWGGMVKKGADTFWEVYDPENDFLSPYNFYPTNSYCHAWSCTPVYFIRKYPDIFQASVEE